MRKYDVLEVLKLAHKTVAMSIPTMDKHGEHTAALALNELTSILHQTILQFEEETGSRLVQ